MSRFYDGLRRWFRYRPRAVPPAADDSQPMIDFGGLELFDSEATSHFLALGTTGSAKTLTLRRLMQSTLPRIAIETDSRAIVFDPKQDALPLLQAMCPDVRIRTTHPFDDRGVSWDLSLDVREPRVAVEIVFTLFPREHESQPFFSDAVRLLAYYTIISWMRSGIDWTLADLFRALSSTRRLKAILKRHPETRDIVPMFFKDRRLLSNIESTIGVKLLMYAPVAAAWEAAKEKFSLEQWIKDNSILVLGMTDTSRTATDAINRCIFKRASDLTLQQSESFTRRNYFFIDEVSETGGPLPGLVSLLKRSRSKGGVVALAAQSTAALKDDKFYGSHMANELLAQIGNRFFGRTEEPDTADWITRLIGEQEIVQTTISKTYSQHNSTTHNQQIVTRRAVLPSELMDLPPCTIENGLTAYYLVRSAGCYRAHFPGDELFGETLIPPRPDVPEFVPRDVEAQYLRPWTDEQAVQFGVPLPDPNKKKRRKREQRPDIDPLTGLDDLDS